MALFTRLYKRSSIALDVLASVGFVKSRVVISCAMCWTAGSFVCNNTTHARSSSHSTSTLWFAPASDSNSTDDTSVYAIYASHQVNYGENMSDTQFDRMVATGEEVVMLDADNDNDEEYIHHASSSSGTLHPVTVTNSSNGSNSKGKHGSKKQANSSKASKDQAFARATHVNTAGDSSRQMAAPQPVQQQHTTGSIGKLSYTVTFTYMLLVPVQMTLFIVYACMNIAVAVASIAKLHCSNYSKCKVRLLAVEAHRQ
jgi:hypothetical protein